MRLSELCAEYATSPQQLDPDIVEVTEDSRQVRPGSLFVAIPGTRMDGHGFVEDAVSRGAAALLLEHPVEAPVALPVVFVPSSRTALAHVSARLHGNPAANLRLIGFTGTFGKTTTSEVIRALLAAGGHRVAVLGSLGARFDGYSDPGDGLTTPSPPTLHRVLGDLRDRWADVVVMEVTSHALVLDRLAGLSFGEFVVAAVVPGEHTDFHHSYRDYVTAKARFIDYLAPGALVSYDADNQASTDLAARAPARLRVGLSLTRRDLTSACDVVVRNVEIDDQGALMTVRGERLRSTLLGSVNVRAVGLALTHALARDIDMRTARRVLATLTPLPRRMQTLSIAGRMVLDDVAAHPDNFRATFEVAALLRRRRLVIAYAIRGRRGADINRRNALALADLALLHAASRVVLTASDDTVGPPDHATAVEIDATRAAFSERACSAIWHDTLSEAMRDVASNSSAGDLIVAVGAQGMDQGAPLLKAAV
jgi:UDP-N-acetylmuramoyl-L-alanyl-D-glutamate--2,6-diaminopimelate ligase